MELKTQILLYLDANRDRYVSGEELISACKISRRILWNQLSALRKEGYEILSEHGLGYRLSSRVDLYTPEAIGLRLKGDAALYRIQMQASLPSTNRTLKEMAKNGAPDGTVLIALQQTAGYGQKDRAFFSPLESGIYLSLLLRPSLSPAQALTLTTTAAVAVTKAILMVTGQHAKIKWVNDIYLNEKKVCGILAEAAVTSTGDKLAYVVLGIGINVLPPLGGFPEELSGIATSIYPEGTEIAGKRTELVAALLNCLAELLPQCTSRTVYHAYRNASFLPGRTVTILRENQSERLATVIDIDQNYRLLVRYADGTTDALDSGEVRIRSLKNLSKE